MASRLKALLKERPAYQRAERAIRFAARRFQEKEIGLLHFVVQPGKIAIDVGAAAGVCTHVLLRLGTPVIAIEANPGSARGLKRLYGKRARVVCAAASSSEGSAILRIPAKLPSGSHGIATVEGRNTLNGAIVDEIEVPRVTLDGLTSSPVGFIKIDVEGHEFDVLLGAQAILHRDRPAILVEAEERHRPGAMQSIRGLLDPLGYHGFMLQDGRLSPISNFDPARDQSVPKEHLADLNAGRFKGRYINNFLFVA